QAATDDPAAVLQFFVPTGFITSIGARAEGDRLGTAKAKAPAAGGGSAALPLAGGVTAALGTTTVSVGGQNSTVAALATACTGSAVHDDYWLLNLSGSGQTLQAPVVVDVVLLG